MSGIELAILISADSVSEIPSYWAAVEGVIANQNDKCSARNSKQLECQLYTESLRAALFQVLEILPTRAQQIVKLRFFLEMPATLIAEIYDSSRQYVMATISDSIEKIRTNKNCMRILCEFAPWCDYNPDKCDSLEFSTEDIFTLQPEEAAFLIGGHSENHG